MNTKERVWLAVFLLVAPAVILVLALLLTAGPTLAADSAASVSPLVLQWGMMAAAISVAASALGAAYAVAQVGSAAVGALAEKPELLGRLLVMVGLAEGIAIYGLIVAILILNRLG